MQWILVPQHRRIVVSNHKGVERVSRTLWRVGCGVSDPKQNVADCGELLVAKQNVVECGCLSVS